MKLQFSLTQPLSQVLQLIGANILAALKPLLPLLELCFQAIVEPMESGDFRVHFLYSVRLSSKQLFGFCKLSFH